MVWSVELAQLQRLLDGGAQVVDVLSPEEYAEEHLPGAVNIPLRQLDAKTAGRLDRNVPVVVYCHDSL